MIKVYVAGASGELERCKRFIDGLDAHPLFKVVRDWPACIAAAGSANRDLTFETRYKHAEANLIAVRACDILVGLIPACETKGFWAELGAAAIFGKTILVSGCAYDEDSSIFLALADQKFLADDSREREGCSKTWDVQERMDAKAAHWLLGWGNAMSKSRDLRQFNEKLRVSPKQET